MELIEKIYTLIVIGIFSCLMLAGCQKSLNQKIGSHNQEDKLMHEQDLEQFQNRAEVLFILRKLELISAPKHAPDTFYIKGIVDDGKFIPQSGVLGVGELAKTGRYGWLELNSKEFHPMESDRKALTPFVKGYMTDNGFVPSLREVFNEP